ncbi:myotubularin-related protein 13-like isoform X3 [Dreissena polymorpha]|uniref:myotubularin-related protein 13-like isoform X3 n=1 Tax=Dreissena polymorpha TaxID=45954 RepID=UPI002264E329|nr:myotubularin-related protein 13-like isoform X3 [Dreissena polymorpha]
MSRLVDYFVIVGYDHEKERSGSSCGKILQRFPKSDWPDCHFTPGIELFCQPTGWVLSSQRQQPTFFISVLTDIDADRHYCACLTFNEPVAMTTKPDDEDLEDPDVIIPHHSQMFAPKSLILITRHDYFETFRNCLGIIYTAYVDKLPQVEIETLVGNMIGCVQAPPLGGPQVRFSIGAGDRQALQPALCSTLPITRHVVALLFQQLGIQNVINVFALSLTDHKILFLSQSFSRLTESCHAILSLQYPLKYTYVYIPILPSALLEVLNTPTPFIAGVHSIHKEDIKELLDVVVIDLDGGSVHIPECIVLPTIPEPVLSRTMKALHMILHQDLLMADLAFPPSPCKKPVSLEQKDKEIRAVFIRMLSELLTGYRSCLTLIRIHPEPFITFHKASFLGHKGMVEEDFILKVLNGMSFNTFVSERGPPYRVCDIFDEVYANIQENVRDEKLDSSKMVLNISDLAQQLHNNENPNPQPYVQKVPRPTEGAYSRIHQPTFPVLDEDKVAAIIEDGISNQTQNNNDLLRLTSTRLQKRIVPMGQAISTVGDRQKIVDNNARRLEVLRNCVNFIFDNKISDARIIFPAVLRALKGKVARIALTSELAHNIQSNRAMLEHQQFDLIVRLLNCALQNDSSMDENGVAASILPLATSFCRKLCTGVIQFAYTLCQDHAVWGNQQFWEAAFYQDVQKDIRQLYAHQYEEHIMVRWRKEGSRQRHSMELNVNQSQRLSPDQSRSSMKQKEIGALDIAAEQLRIWSTLTEAQQQEMINNEESTVYSQAIHYANRIVYMRVPLDCSRSLKNLTFDDETKSNSNITASLAESDSIDAESGFDETEVSGSVAPDVIRFVTRFVDKVCQDSGVTEDHIKSLHQMIPGVVAMHMETLEAVNREAKRLPPIQKPRILTPALLPGEEIVMEGLRVYLLADGREEGTGVNMGGPSLLPAEGAIFLTTYRIIFKGIPCDPLACEAVIMRAFPVSTLTKEKKLNVQYLPHLNQWLQEGLQLRSNIFQLLKIAFDDEVVADNVETFRKLVNKCRNPPTVFDTFAFSGHSIPQPVTLHKQKEKNKTLKHFAKKTLMKTAQKAGLKSGLKSKHSSSHQKAKYSLSPPQANRRSLTPRSSDSESEGGRPGSEVFDDLSIVDENEFGSTLMADPQALEKLLEKPGYHDYVRLGLGSLSVTSSKDRSNSEPFRISSVNANFSVCRSYPILLVVPQSVSDDNIRRFARTHRQCRFPVITWRHSRTKALLLRASSFHSRGLMGMLKHNTSSTTSSGESTSSLEQEKYFSVLVAATPNSARNGSYKASYSDSLDSLDSLIMSGATGESLTIPETPDNFKRAPKTGKSVRTSLKLKGQSGNGDFVGLHLSGDTTPNTARRSMFSRAVNTLRHSGGKGHNPLTRIGSSKERNRTSTFDPARFSHPNGDVSQSGDLIHNSVQGLKKVSLYVLGEKTQMKGVKMESFPKCDFIPVDFYEVRYVKASFKKLMRACVPSSGQGPEGTFLHAVEESGWLPQLQNILQLAGATVDLLDVQGSSVMVCLEDGWDATTQVVALAQLLLDPFYRTLDGFKALVEKEWLSFGHRFTHRSNQTQATQASGFAPIFLQWLDVVHQVHHQFPLSFEFNQYYIKFLAYHYISNRFRTFMLDNELERMEAGWLLEEKRAHRLDDLDEEAGFTQKHFQQGSLGVPIWDYIDKLHRKSPLFYNFMYSPGDQENVLRPYSNLANLKVWDYFTTEDLAHGPSYDIEVAQKELSQNEETETLEMLGQHTRRVVNGCYDNVMLQQPDYFQWQFQEIQKLERDLEHLPRKWKTFWDRLQTPARDPNSLPRETSLSMQLARSHGRSIHKRSTLEILVKGKMLGEAARSFAQPHRFEEMTYTTAVNCDLCSELLWGLVKPGMHCIDCGYNCHEKCQSSVPKNCTKLKAVSDSSNSSSSVSRPSLSETRTIQAPVAERIAMTTTTNQMYERYPQSSNEHVTQKGWLYKRGAFKLKGWKKRWFVLDSMKHQMRWYDSETDPNARGQIDLSEVEEVRTVGTKHVQGIPKQGLPKKVDENGFFELKSTKRLFHFLAANAEAAHEWVDKVQGCIQ